MEPPTLHLTDGLLSNGDVHPRYTLHGAHYGPGAYELQPSNGSYWTNASGIFDLATNARCDWVNQSLVCNMTTNNTSSGLTDVMLAHYSTWQLVFLGTLAGVTSLITVLGNLVVILSFVLERTIRQPTNYFIASLAVSDLLIGAISMPFYTIYLLMGQKWPLGKHLCDLWLSLDYTICLTSIYTVLCITIDRFCSVKIPATYRSWRTGSRVNTMIAITWIVPILLFFTSIFGWQHFVGKRTVPVGSCYVQYMENAIFNCVLQVTYFWLTLSIMCGLYTGIYKAALQLHRKSRAKEKKMNSLVSMAGQTMTQIGIGMSKNKQENSKTRKGKSAKGSKGQAPNVNNVRTPINRLVPKYSTTQSDESELRTGTCDVEEERSSSPAFPSDGEPGSPGVSQVPNKNGRLPAASAEESAAPPMVYEPVLKKKRSRSIKGSEEARIQHLRLLESSGIYMGPMKEPDTPPPTPTPPASPQPKPPVTVPAQMTAISEDVTSPLLTKGAIPHAQTEAVTFSDDVSGTEEAAEKPKDVAYIDQEGSKVQQETKESFQLFGDMPRVQIRTNYQTYTIEDPGSPVWKKREEENENTSGETGEKASSADNHGYSNPVCDLPTAKVQLESSDITGSNVKSRLAKSDDVTSRRKRKKSRKISELSYGAESNQSAVDEPDAETAAAKTSTSSNFKTIMKGVGSRKRVRKPSKKEKQRSKGENRARKALRTITIILGAFVICWTPWHVLSMIIGFCAKDEVCVWPILYDISYWLCYLNSPINPLCYALANQQFKRAFIRIIKLDWRRT